MFADLPDEDLAALKRRFKVKDMGLPAVTPMAPIFRPLERSPAIQRPIMLWDTPEVISENSEGVTTTEGSIFEQEFIEQLLEDPEELSTQLYTQPH